MMTMSPLTMAQPLLDRGPFAAVARTSGRARHRRDLALLGQQLAGPISRAVVDDDDLLLEGHRADAVEQLGDGRPLVVARDHNGELQPGTSLAKWAPRQTLYRALRPAWQKYLLGSAVHLDGVVEKIVCANRRQDGLRVQLGVEHHGMVAPGSQISHQSIGIP